ncbi:MAG: hypothetical protein N4J56_002421 [Chroococcidiopsis sp. SAG 2025]|nr:hypothetical protein [Chroococcidiopsis sp. SAG 2025]
MTDRSLHPTTPVASTGDTPARRWLPHTPHPFCATHSIKEAIAFPGSGCLTKDSPTSTAAAPA